MSQSRPASTLMRVFERGLHAEHLEEVSFLYEQRLGQLKNPAMAWSGLAEIEDRIEAHLDALVVGGELALEVCRERAAQGDFGELFAAVSVFCRSQRPPLLAELLRTLDPQDRPKAAAMADALKYELPAEWTAFVEQAIATRDARLLPLLAAVSGYRRLSTGAALYARLRSAIEPAVEAIDALGRMQTLESADMLTRWLRHPRKEVQAASTVALLRLGQSPLMQDGAAGGGCLGLALGGGRAAVASLMETIEHGQATPDGLLALGLLGDPSALRALHQCLDVKALAEPAALALSWISGADLAQEVFVPEAVNEDELFPLELAAWRARKTPPTRSDGKPFGENIRKLSVDPQAWRQWFVENAGHFEPRMRYRCGQPFTPAALVDNLAQPHSHPRLRQMAAHELVVRYRCDVPFEVDMPVDRQWAAIDDMRQWLAGHAAQFRPGAWYFAGSSQ